MMSLSTFPRALVAVCVLAGALQPAAAQEPQRPDPQPPAVGGLGAPDGRAAKNGRAGRTKRRKQRRPRTVVLPDPGRYRAPAILRLAGKLADRPVRVAHKSLNDVRVEITPRLAR